MKNSKHREKIWYFQTFRYLFYLSYYIFQSLLNVFLIFIHPEQYKPVGIDMRCQFIFSRFGFKNLPYDTQHLITFFDSTGAVDQLKICHIHSDQPSYTIFFTFRAFLKCHKIISQCNGILIRKCHQFFFTFAPRINIDPDTDRYHSQNDNHQTVDRIHDHLHTAC